MMTFIKAHKAPSMPNEDAVLPAARHPKSARCNKTSSSPESLAGAWPGGTLNYAAAPQITQMEVISLSEVTVSTMDVLGLQ